VLKKQIKQKHHTGRLPRYAKLLGLQAVVFGRMIKLINILKEINEGKLGILYHYTVIGKNNKK
jgi:hypothetical protein